MPNYNEKTKLAYGVVDARNVPELWDEIQQNGDDLSWEAQKKELQDRIRAAIRGVVEDYASDSFVDDITDRADPAEIVEVLLDAGLNDEMATCDDDPHEYHYKSSDGCEYLLGSLGGAPIIWVMDSPYVAFVRPCSPCIPGAGDLDTIDENSNSGVASHCCPPDCFAPAVDLSEASEGMSIDNGYITPHWQTINGRTYKVVQRHVAESAE